MKTDKSARPPGRPAAHDAWVGGSVIPGSDESQILNYLNLWPEAFIPEQEIARRANGKARFREDPDWACRSLAKLYQLGLVEVDERSRVRIRRDPVRNCGKTKRFVAPRVRELLGGKGYCLNCFTRACGGAA